MMAAVCYFRAHWKILLPGSYFSKLFFTEIGVGVDIPDYLR